MNVIHGLWSLFLLCLFTHGVSQTVRVEGRVLQRNNGNPLPGTTVAAKDAAGGTVTDSLGRYVLTVQKGAFLKISCEGFRSAKIRVNEVSMPDILLDTVANELNPVVVTGTMKAVRIAASPIPVEVYTSRFLFRNPTPSIFDALQLVNGVRPQLNCNVCNTGDIHINGLEGPYTLVLIDGMPVMSSLASVYGLTGIPNSLIERVEIVKGPASSLYGSEAIGGCINIITKNPLQAPRFSFESSITGWGEYNLQATLSGKKGKKSASLTGLDYFHYSNPVDNNGDGFTDVTLQKRISVFRKNSWTRRENRVAGLAARYLYEDRWGGEMRWNKNFRGGDSVYGESIYTSRVELIGNYQLPFPGKWMLNGSFVSHVQRSAYGKTDFNADQKTAFAQLTWDKNLGSQDFLAGAVFRYTRYDDNTVITMDSANRTNRVDITPLPGLFLQNESTLGSKQKLLLGMRWDFHPRHGSIFTPRIAWKITFPNQHILRLNAGSGFRVVNIFTEEHAALTGARTVVIEEKLKPEKSLNASLNYTKQGSLLTGWYSLDANAWFTRFGNRIFPDYETNPDQIIYRNLGGYSVSRGFSLNTGFGFKNGINGHLGITLQDIFRVSKGRNETAEKLRPMLTEKWSGTWSVSWPVFQTGFTVDYTGNVYGPMKLPLLSPLDPRRINSPVWSIQNIQVSYRFFNGWVIYGGVKNLLNFTPNRNNPFLIARAHDPFDKQVKYDTLGKITPDADNPYALSFDTGYVYAPNQGLRLFAGFRFQVK